MKQRAQGSLARLSVDGDLNIEMMMMMMKISTTSTSSTELKGAEMIEGFRVDRVGSVFLGPQPRCNRCTGVHMELLEIYVCAAFFNSCCRF